VLRIIIEQDDRMGTPQIQALTAPDQSQARDGGGAPSIHSILRSRAIKGSSLASTSITHRRVVDARDAGAAPRVLQTQAMRKTMVPFSQGNSMMDRPSNGGAAPGGKA